MEDFEILATSDGTPRELTPEGTYLGRCVEMVEIGIVPDSYEGKEKFSPKIRIGWELPEELKVYKDGEAPKPTMVYEEYTLFMGDKANLRKTLTSWRGKAFTEDEAKSFNVAKLLGATCLINIIHKPSTKDPSKVYEKIASVSPILKSMTAPAQITPFKILSFKNWSQETFDALPEFVRKKIETSEQYKKMFSATPPNTEDWSPDATNVPSPNSNDAPLEEPPF